MAIGLPPSLQRVTAQRLDSTFAGIGSASLQQDLKVARALAQALDANFNIGGFRFGFDALIGLIPVAGDAIGFVIGLYPVYLARKHKLGTLVITRMLSNLGIEFLLGIVPVAGPAFDAVLKANLRNFKLLEDAVAKKYR